MGMSVFLSFVILVSMIIVDVCRCHCRWSMVVIMIVHVDVVADAHSLMLLHFSVQS